MHPFDLVPDDELAVAHLRAPEALGPIFSRQLMLRYRALDKAHLERSEGDYCPFDCEQCDALRVEGINPR